MKCIITDVIADWRECITMEEAEDWFRNGRFARVMKGLDDYFIGHIVSSDTPLRGHVEEMDSLSIWESKQIFSEYIGE